jgi:hypothetical protein
VNCDGFSVLCGIPSQAFSAGWEVRSHSRKNQEKGDMSKTEFTITPESQVAEVEKLRLSQGWLCEYRSYVSYKSGMELNLLQIWSKQVA